MRTLAILLLACTLPLAACERDPAPPATIAPAELRIVRFQVTGMTCGGCETAITQTLLQQPGVSEAGADHVAGTAWAEVGPDAADPTALAAVIDTLGYQASPVLAEP